MNVCECPRCGEIEFVIGETGAGYCKNCSHYEQHVPKPDPQPTYQKGFMLRRQA